MKSDSKAMRILKLMGNRQNPCEDFSQFSRNQPEIPNKKTPYGILSKKLMIQCLICLDINEEIKPLF